MITTEAQQHLKLTDTEFEQASQLFVDVIKEFYGSKKLYTYKEGEMIAEIYNKNKNVKPVILMWICFKISEMATDGTLRDLVKRYKL